jgi:hypothetical protein
MSFDPVQQQDSIEETRPPSLNDLSSLTIRSLSIGSPESSRPLRQTPSFNQREPESKEEYDRRVAILIHDAKQLNIETSARRGNALTEDTVPLLREALLLEACRFSSAGQKPQSSKLELNKIIALLAPEHIAEALQSSMSGQSLPADNLIRPNIDVARLKDAVELAQRFSTAMSGLNGEVEPMMLWVAKESFATAIIQPVQILKQAQSVQRYSQQQIDPSSVSVWRRQLEIGELLGKIERVADNNL